MTDSLAPNRVVAVVVSYRPEPSLFAKVVAAVDQQVAMTIIVDNADGVGFEQVAFRERVERLDMKRNAGVAAAQNAGIRRALEVGATHVLILDHDSVPRDGMTERLLSVSDDLRTKGERVAATGADYRDSRRPLSLPFVVMRRWGFGRAAPSPSARSVPVPFLISAGSLISVEALAAVGLMDERLFIDYVDIEWCLRARTKGWTCHGVPGARLDHCLGDEVLTWGRAREPLQIFGRTLPSRTPLRHYYLFRNGLWLLFHGALPLRWKLLEALRLAAGFVAFALFATPRSEQLSAMLHGALDGLRGRLGPAALRGTGAR